MVRQKEGGEKNFKPSASRTKGRVEEGPKREGNRCARQKHKPVLDRVAQWCKEKNATENREAGTDRTKRAYHLDTTQEWKLNLRVKKKILRIVLKGVLALTRKKSTTSRPLKLGTEEDGTNLKNGRAEKTPEPF